MSDPYWSDIVRLLQVFWSRRQSRSKEEHVRRLDGIRGELASASYKPYVDGRKDLPIRAVARNAGGNPETGSVGHVAK